MPDGSTYPQNSHDFTVNVEDLLADLLQIDGKKDEVSSATGDLRSTLKAILESRGYHKTALAMVRQINDMPATKKADFLRTFEPMFSAMLGTWKKEVADMLDKAEQETSEMEKDLGGDV